MRWPASCGGESDGARYGTVHGGCDGMSGGETESEGGEWDYARLGRGKRATGQDMVKEEGQGPRPISF